MARHSHKPWAEPGAGPRTLYTAVVREPGVVPERVMPERTIGDVIFAAVAVEGPKGRHFETTIDLQGREAEDDDWRTLARFPPRGGQQMVDAMPIMRFVTWRLDTGVTATLTLFT